MALPLVLLSDSCCAQKGKRNDEMVRRQFLKWTDVTNVDSSVSFDVQHWCDLPGFEANPCLCMSPKVLLQEWAYCGIFLKHRPTGRSESVESSEPKDLLSSLVSWGFCRFWIIRMLVQLLHHRECCTQRQIEKWTKCMRIGGKDRTEGYRESTSGARNTGVLQCVPERGSLSQGMFQGMVHQSRTSQLYLKLSTQNMYKSYHWTKVWDLNILLLQLRRKPALKTSAVSTSPSDSTPTTNHETQDSLICNTWKF